MNKVWGPTGDIEEGDIFRLKFDNIRNTRQFVKESSLLQLDQDDVVGKNKPSLKVMHI